MDESFNRAVILLTEYNTKSVVGFIMNRPLSYMVSDLIPELDCDLTIYHGGPVEQDNLYFIHKVPNLIQDSIEVASGIYWGGNFETLRSLLSERVIEPIEIRFFLGYTGWDKLQLDNELETNSWLVSANDYPNILAEDCSTLWRNKIIQKGGHYKLWANAPKDFNLN